jgi:hypothetical protein
MRKSIVHIGLITSLSVASAVALGQSPAAASDILVIGTGEAHVSADRATILVLVRAARQRRSRRRATTRVGFAPCSIRCGRWALALTSSRR